MPTTHTYAILGPVPPGTSVWHWTVITEAPRQHGLRYLLCRCVCGAERTVFIHNLRTGLSKSCGCQHPNRTHGMSSSPESVLWRAIKQRCYNPRNNAFHNYGGRGIRMCDRWLKSFEAFLEDVGSRPSPELTLDRIDNEGHYEPGNVRWATRKEQVSNTRLTKADRVARGRVNAMKRWHPESVRHISSSSSS